MYIHWTAQIANEPMLPQEQQAPAPSGRSFVLALLHCMLLVRRYQPAIYAGEWWRLFSSICLHGSFAHLFSNMLVFVVLAVPLEHRWVVAQPVANPVLAHVSCCMLSCVCHWAVEVHGDSSSNQPDGGLQDGIALHAAAPRPGPVQQPAGAFCHCM
jgi:membrane associated rhomboid family serine protease